MEFIPPSQAALREALSLSEEIIRNIEMMEIPLTNCALKASRLARITNNFEYQKIMGYEASGYPTTPNGVEGSVYKLAVIAQRENQKKDSKTKEISKYISLESIEELERTVSSAQAAIEAARDPNVSVASSNPNQMVFNPSGNKFERDTIRKQVSDAQRLLSKRRSFIYSYALQKHYELKFSGIADDIFSRIRESVDSAIGEQVPDAAQKLSAVYEALQSENPENWSNAVHSCRRILQDLADSVFPACEDKIIQVNGKDKTIKLGKENYINRIISYIEDNSDSSRFSELVGSQLGFMGDRLDSLFKAAQKGSHDNIVSREEADRYVVYTYMVVGDILSLKN